jgi:selenocysteine-specific elongation factor
MGNENVPPLCLGTAGHVDHGKTCLVRALTGKDTDRLPEERARGISIDLGYAPLELPGGLRLSVVDVPGHERFVRTMVAGATGIDLFLLVVDAAEGARRQTHEHLAILRLLGIDVGVVAVTKSDTVDAETLDVLRAELAGLVPGSQAVAVSARTGEGLDHLCNALASAASRVKPAHRRAAPTRLFVDRVFTLRGVGTVVTGTLWSGSIGVGDELRGEPAGLDVRVRSVQVHDRPVERAEAGQRVAVSLARLRRSALRRGDALLQHAAYPTTYRLDVVLDELESLDQGARVRVHHGTAEIPARVIRAGERFAQLRLSKPAVAARDDRLVLRTHTTVAGGRVLDPLPARHADLTRFELLERCGPRQTSRRTPGSPLDRPAPVARSLDSERAHEAARLEEALLAAGTAGMRVEDRVLAEYLELEKRAVRLGADHAVSAEAYETARAVLFREAERQGSITLARFRDLLGVSRRPAQLLLERFDADRLTRRVRDERVLRKRART